MKIVHAADVHIDSPLYGLSLLDDASGREREVPPEITLATRRAFERLVDLCIDEKAALLLLAGDLFHEDWKEYNTGLFVVRQFRRLEAAGTQVALVRGNHDAGNVITRNLSYPSNVFEFSTRRAESKDYPDMGVIVHGQSFGDRNIHENLAQRFPRQVSDRLNIGLLHTNATGTSEHGAYTPSSVEELLAHGYDYWALGHVHTHSFLHGDEETAAARIAYSGALQGRHALETGPKGCVLLEIDQVACRILSAKFVPLDVARWAEVKVDAEGCRSVSAVLNVATRLLAQARVKADGRHLLARLRIIGPLDAAVMSALTRDPAHLRAEVEARALLLGDDIWLERILMPSPSESNSHAPKVLAGTSDGEEELVDFAQALRREFARLRGMSHEALSAYLPDLERLHYYTNRFGLKDSPSDMTHICSLLDEAESLLIGSLYPPPATQDWEDRETE